MPPTIEREKERHQNQNRISGPLYIPSQGSIKITHKEQKGNKAIPMLPNFSHFITDEMVVQYL